MRLASSSARSVALARCILQTAGFHHIRIFTRSSSRPNVTTRSAVFVNDFEGAASMQVSSFFAPVGAPITGLLLGIWWQTRKR